MKKSIPITIILFFAFITLQISGLKAQTHEGTIRYLRTQNWAKMMAAVDYISKQQRERMMYMWGTRSE